jgi:predicted dehydrogenase
VNVAAIGRGRCGSELPNLVLKHHENKPDVKAVVLYDVDSRRLSRAFRKALRVKTYKHHQAHMRRSGIDAVFITAFANEFHLGKL